MRCSVTRDRIAGFSSSCSHSDVGSVTSPPAGRSKAFPSASTSVSVDFMALRSRVCGTASSVGGGGVRLVFVMVVSGQGCGYSMMQHSSGYGTYRPPDDPQNFISTVPPLTSTGSGRGVALTSKRIFEGFFW